MTVFLLGERHLRSKVKMPEARGEILFQNSPKTTFTRKKKQIKLSVSQFRKHW